MRRAEDEDAQRELVTFGCATLGPSCDAITREERSGARPTRPKPPCRRAREPQPPACRASAASPSRSFPCRQTARFGSARPPRSPYGGPALRRWSGPAESLPAPGARRPGSVRPEALEAVCSELGVSDGVLNVAVTEVVLKGPRVDALVRQLVSGRVPQHVRVYREAKRACLADPRERLAETRQGHRRVSLGLEQVAPFRLLSPQPPERPQLLGAEASRYPASIRLSRPSAKPLNFRPRAPGTGCRGGPPSRGGVARTRDEPAARRPLPLCPRPHWPCSDW